MAQPIVQQVETPDGISWYTESFHPSGHDSNQSSHQYVVFIPSGEGDCSSFRRAAQIVSSSGPYSTLTFDIPGYSRTIAPPEAYKSPTHELLAKQVVGLLDKLNIQSANVFGSSSGGIITLALATHYPSRVKLAMVHEVPLRLPEGFSLGHLTDEQIVGWCQQTFKGAFIEQDPNDGHQKWDALGPEYHARLKKNYVTWVRCIVGNLENPAGEMASNPKNLQKVPIFWTVGALTDGVSEKKGMWESNWDYAGAAGIEVNNTRLQCKHFPYITIPEDFAAYILECLSTVQT